MSVRWFLGPPRYVAPLLLISLSLAGGCGGSGSTAEKPTGSHTTAPPPHPPTTVPAVVPSTVAAPSGPGYEAARQQFIGDGLVGSSALQNTALALAVMDLEQGETTDAGNRTQYPSVIAAIEDFERLPITGVTPAQNAEGRSDLAIISKFFGLSPESSCGPDGLATTRGAAVAWFTEPDDTTSGVDRAPLMTAVADLEVAERDDPSGTACYPAAVDDLEDLEGATPADIAASGAPGGNHADTRTGAEIGYLNEFFTVADPPASAMPLTEPCPSC